MKSDVRRFGRLLVALVLLAGSVSAGCAGQRRSDQAVIVVDAPVALADQPVHMKITSLAPRDRVTVRATALDYQRTPWRGTATFRADDRGTVDLDRARPASGDYAGVDGMGLFWSMNPPAGSKQAGFYPPYPTVRAAYQVQITVAAHGRTLAERTLTRRWLTEGVTHRSFGVSKDGVVGELFLPPPGTGRRTPVLLFGGSEGGDSMLFEAALLASRGHPALTLAYFRERGLPGTLKRIPLEYFVRAAKVLAGQPGADPARLTVVSASRGTEAALLLAQHYPDLVHGAVVYAPSSLVHPGFPDFREAAWTHEGRAVATESIDLDRVNGPILAIAGTDDGLWAAANSARQIMTELDAAGDRFPHQALIYQGAGHRVGSFPYLASSTEDTHPITGAVLTLGGSRAANAAAQKQSWPKVLAMLAEPAHRTPR